MIGYSCTTRPLGSGQGLTVMSQYAAISLVATLFNCCCPAAVSRFIVAIVVYPLQAVRWRWLPPHIREKVVKRLLPSFAHFYASTAVVFVVGTLWVVTSLIHGVPCVVLLGVTHAMSPTSISTTMVFLLNTTAAPGTSITQASTLNYGGTSACAYTSPAVILSSSGNLTANVRSDSQSAKGISAKVLKSERQNDTLEIIHGMSFREKGNLWSGLGSVPTHYPARIILADQVCY